MVIHMVVDIGVVVAMGLWLYLEVIVVGMVIVTTRDG